MTEATYQSEQTSLMCSMPPWLGRWEISLFYARRPKRHCSNFGSISLAAPREEAQNFLDHATRSMQKDEDRCSSASIRPPRSRPNDLFRPDRKLLPRPKAEASTYTRRMVCQFTRLPCRTENSRTAAKEGHHVEWGDPKAGDDLELARRLRDYRSLFTYLTVERTAAKREAETQLVRDKVAQPLSVTIRDPPPPNTAWGCPMTRSASGNCARCCSRGAQEETVRVGLRRDGGSRGIASPAVLAN